MAILTGELKPRERLVESELIKKFNVKRFTIRKAIQELVHLGFVEFTPNKGARVADITDEELEDTLLRAVEFGATGSGAPDQEDYSGQIGPSLEDS